MDCKYSYENNKIVVIALIKKLKTLDLQKAEAKIRLIVLSELIIEILLNHQQEINEEILQNFDYYSNLTEEEIFFKIVNF